LEGEAAASSVRGGRGERNRLLLRCCWRLSLPGGGKGGFSARPGTGKGSGFADLHTYLSAMKKEKRKGKRAASRYPDPRTVRLGRGSRRASQPVIGYSEKRDINAVRCQSGVVAVPRKPVRRGKRRLSPPAAFRSWGEKKKKGKTNRFGQFPGAAAGQGSGGVAWGKGRKRGEKRPLSYPR